MMVLIIARRSDHAYLGLGADFFSRFTVPASNRYNYPPDAS